MALTAEQQLAIDFEEARESGRRAHELATENRRSEPADSRALTADDITTFANSLLAYVHA